MTPERRVLGSLGGYRDSDLGASAALRLTGLAPSRPASSSTLNAHSISRRISPASLMSPKRKSETLSGARAVRRRLGRRDRPRRGSGWRVAGH